MWQTDDSVNTLRAHDKTGRQQETQIGKGWGPQNASQPSPLTTDYWKVFLLKVLGKTK